MPPDAGGGPAQQIRCTGPYQGRHCNKLLGFVSGEKFRLEIKCPRCSFINSYTRANVPPEVVRRPPPTLLPSPD